VLLVHRDAISVGIGHHDRPAEVTVERLGEIGTPFARRPYMAWASLAAPLLMLAVEREPGSTPLMLSKAAERAGRNSVTLLAPPPMRTMTDSEGAPGGGGRQAVEVAVCRSTDNSTRLFPKTDPPVGCAVRLAQGKHATP
jgi:hypothetical protein